MSLKVKNKEKDTDEYGMEGIRVRFRGRNGNCNNNVVRCWLAVVEQVPKPCIHVHLGRFHVPLALATAIIVRIKLLLRLKQRMMQKVFVLLQL